MPHYLVCGSAVFCVRAGIQAGAVAVWARQPESCCADDSAVLLLRFCLQQSTQLESMSEQSGSFLKACLAARHVSEAAPGARIAVDDTMKAPAAAAATATAATTATATVINGSTARHNDSMGVSTSGSISRKSNSSSKSN